MKTHLNLPYDEIEGVDPNLLSLDIYAPVADGPHPVVIMIHGGGWRGGDKGNPRIVTAKSRYFVTQGYVYVSINYRLSPAVQHPVHIQDVAKAIAWIHDWISEYGGDPDRMHVMGHSAGGHLAGLVAIDSRWLKAEGKDLSILKSAVLLDPAAYDIPRHVEQFNPIGMISLYRLAFSDDWNAWADASLQSHVAPGRQIPPSLIFYTGNRMNADVLARDLADALTKAGSPSRAVDTVDLEHSQINAFIGTENDKMTALIMRLFRSEDPTTFPRLLGTTL